MIGQIYIPVVNWFLLVGGRSSWCSASGSSTNLAARLRHRGHAAPSRSTRCSPSSSSARCGRSRSRLVIPASARFLIVDLAFFAANLTEVLDGGWFPLVVGAACLHHPDHLAARAARSWPSRCGGPRAAAPYINRMIDEPPAADPRHRRLPDDRSRPCRRALLNNAQHNGSSTSASSS